MKACSFVADDGQTQIGVEYQGQLYNFSLAWEIYKSLKNRGQGPNLGFLQVMVEADFFHSDTFQEVINALDEVRPLDDLKLPGTVQFLPPIGRPQKIIGIGRNYREHAEELGNEVPEEPVFFAKAVSSLIGHKQEIKLPLSVGRVDHEGELAIIVGKHGENIPKAAAIEHIAGYGILNDVTAREIQRADQRSGLPWFRSKSFDTFCPFGPFIVPKDIIPDAQDLKLIVKVNGEVRQQASTSQLLFGPAEIISHLSKFCTLEPGDVIATGTPSGVGPLLSGDEVEVEISEIGCLKNSVK